MGNVLLLRLVAGLVDHEVDVRGPQVVAVLRAYQLPHRPVHGDRVAGWLHGAELALQRCRNPPALFVVG
jgi:hypothetical protein